MKKKNARSERLSEWLAQIDNDLLNEAYSVDSAEQLKKQIESEKIGRKTRSMPKYAFRGIMAAALCLLLIVGAMIAVPALLENGDPIEEPHMSVSLDADKPPKPNESEQNPHSEAPSHSNDLPNIVLPTDQLHIDSIDMLNYYSAIRILTDSPTSRFSDLSAVGRRPHGFSLLAAGDDNTQPYGDNTQPYDDNTEEPTASEEQTSLPPSESPDIFYYEFDPEETFTLRHVLFFQIEVTDEAEFLAEKVGTGVVDVVITDGVFGDWLITLKNGDRYYSCLENGGSYFGDSGDIEFSAHKYIEGFHVVKNFEQAWHTFNVSIGSDHQVDYFDCDWCLALPIVSKTRVSNNNNGYTIAELEAYFSAGELPEA